MALQWDTPDGLDLAKVRVRVRVRVRVGVRLG
jgi:hypothetical protein